MFDLTLALTPVALIEGTSRCTAYAGVAEAKGSSGSMAAVISSTISGSLEPSLKLESDLGPRQSEVPSFAVMCRPQQGGLWGDCTCDMDTEPQALLGLRSHTQVLGHKGCEPVR